MYIYLLLRPSRYIFMNKISFAVATVIKQKAKADHLLTGLTMLG